MYPWPSGKTWLRTANSSSRISARKKYGIAWKNMSPGRARSSQPPCRQPAMMPRAVPTKKAMSVAVPTSVIVQGIVWTSRLDTLAGYWDTSVPKLKCETSTRYAQYWCQMEPGWPTPSMASSAR